MEVEPFMESLAVHVGETRRKCNSDSVSFLHVVATASSSAPCSLPAARRPRARNGAAPNMQLPERSTRGGPGAVNTVLMCRSVHEKDHDMSEWDESKDARVRSRSITKKGNTLDGYAGSRHRTLTSTASFPISISTRDIYLVSS